MFSYRDLYVFTTLFPSPPLPETPFDTSLQLTPIPRLSVSNLTIKNSSETRFPSRTPG